MALIALSKAEEEDSEKIKIGEEGPRIQMMIGEGGRCCETQDEGVRGGESYGGIGGGRGVAGGESYGDGWICLDRRSWFDEGGEAKWQRFDSTRSEKSDQCSIRRGEESKKRSASGSNQRNMRDAAMDFRWRFCGGVFVGVLRWRSKAQPEDGSRVGEENLGSPDGS